MKSLFTIKGTVREGNKRGKKLGFPTMNLPVDQKIPEGVYISQTEFADQLYNSLTFVGVVKTYNETVFHTETYLLQFNENVYGKNISVYLLKKLRENQKFNSEEELILQMKKDKEDAEAFFILYNQ